jgi:hypothetical protein
MLKCQELEKVIRMFNDKSEAAKNARVSVELPNGSLWDLGEIFLATNKIRNFVIFSPHQISFHSRHPQNRRGLVKHLGHGCLKLVPGSMLACLLDEGFACLSVDRARWSTVLESLLAC